MSLFVTYEAVKGWSGSKSDLSYVWLKVFARLWLMKPFTAEAVVKATSIMSNSEFLLIIRYLRPIHYIWLECLLKVPRDGKKLWPRPAPLGFAPNGAGIPRLAGLAGRDRGKIICPRARSGNTIPASFTYIIYYIIYIYIIKTFIILYFFYQSLYLLDWVACVMQGCRDVSHTT